MYIPGTGATARPGSPSLLTRATTIIRDFGEVACDHLELAMLEAQRAGIGLAKMLCAAVVVSILLVSAWLALLASGIVWATAEGVSWSGALAIAALLNLIAAGALVLWMRGHTSELLFTATLRQLRRDTGLAENRT